MGVSDAYREAGVDLEAGNSASALFHQICRESWGSRSEGFGEPILLSDGPFGVRGASLRPIIDIALEFPDEEFVHLHCADGTGNKPKVAQRVGTHITIGEDLVAMCADDASAMGAEPISMTNVLVVNSLTGRGAKDEQKVRFQNYLAELAQGLTNGAGKANLVVDNGEIAEHGDSVGGYGEFRYDWSGSVAWFGLKSRLLDGSKVKPGDSVVAIRENGFRCNGLSLVLKTLEERFGYEWHREQINELLTWGDIVLQPSQIYTRLITSLTGGYDPRVEPKADISSIAHITGGGIPEKLGRRLDRLGVGAHLDNLFEPAEAMKQVQDFSGISDAEIYNVLNMGQGLLIVTTEPDKVIAEALHHGQVARMAGEITDKPGLKIVSRGNEGTGKLIILS